MMGTQLYSKITAVLQLINNALSVVLTLVGLTYLKRTVADAKVTFLYASNRCVYFLHVHKLPIIKRCFNLSVAVFKN